MVNPHEVTYYQVKKQYSFSMILSFDRWIPEQVKGRLPPVYPVLLSPSAKWGT